MVVVDATAAIGPGTGPCSSARCARSSASPPRRPATQRVHADPFGDDCIDEDDVAPGLIVVVNKVDKADNAQVMERLTRPRRPSMR